MQHYFSPHWAGGFRALAKPFVLTLAVLCALGWLITPAFAADKRWTGSASANWSDPSNWEPVGVPRNGDSLIFVAGLDSHREMVNDLSGLTVTNVSIGYGDYQLDGNPLTILSVLDVQESQLFPPNPSYTVTINCPLIFTRDASIVTGGVYGALTETTIDVHLNGPITVQSGTLMLIARASDVDGGGNGHIYVSGAISGAGNVLVSSEIKDGHLSTVEFNGTPGNSFGGTLFLQSSGNAPILFNKSSGFVAANRVAVINGSSVVLHLAAPDQIGGLLASEWVILNGKAAFDALFTG
jgi:hypothetical protein